MNNTGSKLPEIGQMNSAETKPVFELILFREGHSARPFREIQVPGPSENAGGRALEVNVLYTKTPTTVKAIESAVELARGLNARLRLVVAQEVPYAVPLETPPVLVEFQEALFRDIAQGYGLETQVDIFLCRDAEQTFAQRLSPHSIVVLGTPKRWWPTREEKLARRLRRSGHEVMVVYGKKENTYA
jgi:hypothetical protein